MEIHVYRLDSERIRVLVNGDNYVQLFAGNVNVPIDGNPLTELATAISTAFGEIEKFSKYGNPKPFVRPSEGNCLTCVTVGCDRSLMARCGNNYSLYTPKEKDPS